jgi:hypothetical protein
MASLPELHHAGRACCVAHFGYINAIQLLDRFVYADAYKKYWLPYKCA